jgi:hypothetical protein
VGNLSGGRDVKGIQQHTTLHVKVYNVNCKVHNVDLKVRNMHFIVTNAFLLKFFVVVVVVV